jgi:hypothetical protein
LRPVHLQPSCNHKALIPLPTYSVFGAKFVSQENKIIALQAILGRNRSATLNPQEH